MQLISNEKAQLRLMNLHTQMLSQFIRNFKSKITQVYEAKSDDECALQALGNTFLMLNNMM